MSTLTFWSGELLPHWKHSPWIETSNFTLSFQFLCSESALIIDPSNDDWKTTIWLSLCCDSFVAMVIGTTVATTHKILDQNVHWKLLVIPVFHSTIPFQFMIIRCTQTEERLIHYFSQVIIIDSLLKLQTSKVTYQHQFSKMLHFDWFK